MLEKISDIAHTFKIGPAVLALVVCLYLVFPFQASSNRISQNTMEPDEELQSKDNLPDSLILEPRIIEAEATARVHQLNKQEITDTSSYVSMLHEEKDDLVEV